MKKLINCPRCGKLFIPTKWEICDDCYDKYKRLNKGILDFINNSPEESIHINNIIEEFNITAKELEALLSQCKLIDFAGKIVFNCLTCGELSTAEQCYSFVCKKCSQKIKATVGQPKKRTKNIPDDEE